MWAVWITGLPGSGKSTIARELLKLLKINGIKAEYLRMDEIRKFLTPEMKYTDEEREHAYRSLVMVASFLVKNGVNVVIDATGHKRVWRELARIKIKNFVEVYVKCPLEVCIERESNRKGGLVTANIYKKAKERLKSGEKVKGLGEVIGVDVPYEEPVNAEIFIESDKLKPLESTEKIFNIVKNL